MLAPAEQVFYGTIKSYNSEKGWGHIDCDQTRKVYGKDMFVLRSQLSGARVAKGDQVEFRLRQGQQGPEATAVRVLSSAGAGLSELCAAGGGGPGGHWRGPCGHAPATAPLAAAPCWGAGNGQAWGCPGTGGQMWAGGCTPAPAVALAPTTAVTAAAAPAAGAFSGVVRGFAPERGWGHVQSEQCQQIFGRDALLLQNAVVSGTVQDGAAVRFNVRMEPEGPVATEVQVVAAAALGAPPPPPPAAQHWGTQQLQPAGGSWHACAAPGAPAWGTPPAAAAPPPPPLPSSLPPGAAPNGAGGLGAAGLPNGTPAPLWGTGSAHSEWGGGCPQYSQAPCAGGGGGCSGHLWGSQAAQPLQAPFAAAPAPDKQVFFGVVKAFDDEKGWGHISCDVTRQMYGKDMFVLRSSLHGSKITPGDEVQFTLRQGLRGVEATEVRPLSRGAAVVAVNEAAGREFAGVLKMFDGAKGWGFLECEESRQLYGKDIFVHKREFPKGCTPDNGDRLRFVVERGRDARPEARRVSLDAPGGAVAALTAPVALATGAPAPDYGGAGWGVGAAGPGAAQPGGPELPPGSPAPPGYGAAPAPEIGPAMRAVPY